MSCAVEIAARLLVTALFFIGHSGHHILAEKEPCYPHISSSLGSFVTRVPPQQTIYCLCLIWWLPWFAVSGASVPWWAQSCQSVMAACSHPLGWWPIIRENRRIHWGQNSSKNPHAYLPSPSEEEVGGLILSTCHHSPSLFWKGLYSRLQRQFQKLFISCL